MVRGLFKSSAKPRYFSCSETAGSASSSPTPGLWPVHRTSTASVEGLVYCPFPLPSASIALSNRLRGPFDSLESWYGLPRMAVWHQGRSSSPVGYLIVEHCVRLAIACGFGLSGRFGSWKRAHDATIDYGDNFWRVYLVRGIKEVKSQKAFDSLFIWYATTTSTPTHQLVCVTRCFKIDKMLQDSRYLKHLLYT